MKIINCHNTFFQYFDEYQTRVFYTLCKLPMRCRPPGVCPGGRAGVCVRTRRGFACGNCDPGYFAVIAKRVECTECAGNSFYVVLIVATVLLLTASVFYASSGPENSSSNFGIAVSATVAHLINFALNIYAITAISDLLYPLV
eukprot:GHVR01037810.1.p2 GENE.GHVR01037810.1~~GHVR01037810.1.p2  ORF type:complete len:143 (+),score=2.95 GHVR01037810.1:543-971(+)